MKRSLTSRGVLAFRNESYRHDPESPQLSQSPVTPQNIDLCAITSLTAVIIPNVVISIQCLRFRRIVAKTTACLAHGMLLDAKHQAVFRRCLHQPTTQYESVRQHAENA